jgi:hypothetical protein
MPDLHAAYAFLRRSFFFCILFLFDSTLKVQDISNDMDGGVALHGYM